jgi:hypothetical protein
MRSSIERPNIPTRSKHGRAQGLFALAFLCVASFAYPADPSTSRAYVDAAALAGGAAMGAFHFRAGAEVPLSPTWTAGGEGGVYWSSNPHTSLFQADAAGLARWRPMGNKGIFLGPGFGLALVDIRYRTGGEGKAFAARPFAFAEAGWSFGPKKGSLSFDALFRLTVAEGLSISPAVGFRAAYSF